MNNIIDGKLLSLKIKNELKNEIKENGYTPSLVVLQIGDNKESSVYIENKKKACMEVGINFELIRFSDSISEEVIINEIKRLNDDISVNGIIVQLPLSSRYDSGKIINYISDVKDVDGLTYKNVGNLVLENECLIPPTPYAVLELLKAYAVDVESKNVCIVGRSNLVGKPLIQLFLNKNATVSICHSKSKDMISYTKMADILIVATGHPNLITKDMIKNNAVVIDVGINKENNMLVGDVDFSSVVKKASLITPVPGGVGPMTIVCLLKNVIKAYKVQNGK